MADSKLEIGEVTAKMEKYKKALSYLLSRVQREPGCLHEFETCTAGYYPPEKCATCGAQNALGFGFTEKPKCDHNNPRFVSGTTWNCEDCGQNFEREWKRSEKPISDDEAKKRLNQICKDVREKRKGELPGMERTMAEKAHQSEQASHKPKECNHPPMEMCPNCDIL